MQEVIIINTPEFRIFGHLFRSEFRIYENLFIKELNYKIF